VPVGSAVRHAVEHVYGPDQPGTLLVEGIVEPGGFISPRPYATGRVLLSAIAADTIGDVTTATWATASTGARTAQAFSTRLAIDYGVDVPHGLGLTVGDNVTVLVEGEIDLDAAGMWRFSLTANDRGFVELAAPGGDFTRVVDDAFVGTIASYMVTTPGWHRFRAAFADISMAMEFNLLADSPAVTGMFRPVSTDMLRVPVDGLSGYVVDAFDGASLIDHVASTLDTAVLDRAIGPDAFGIPVGALGWSFRWSGQILIETDGDYAFDITSFQGHRMWIDGVLVADTFTTLDAASSTTDAIRLAPGWHDFVAEVSKLNTPTLGDVSVTVASGPQWVGQPIPIDHVRPVVARSTRWVAAASGTIVSIPDGGTSPPHTITLTSIPAGFVPSYIQAAFQINHAALATASVLLAPPLGGNVALLAAGAATGVGTYDGRTSIPVASFGSSWTFTGSDNLVDTLIGEVRIAGITALGSGGTAPFPTTVRYESTIRDLGAVVAFGTVSYQVRTGMTASVELRTCESEAGCASTPWTAVTTGSTPTVAPQRFAQYAVTLSGDGDAAPAFDSFELTYSAQP
jgi:PA14 domain